MLKRSRPAPPPGRRPSLLWRLGLFLLAFVALQFWQAREMQAGAMPPVEGRLADGSPASLAGALEGAGGKPLLLYVWSSSCPICRAEEGTIGALAADWPVLTLAMQSGDGAAVKAFMQERQLAYPALVDARGELAWSLGVRATPSWFVVDRTGAIRFSGMGYTSGWGLRARLWWADRVDPRRSSFL
ncbi:MAG TPA: redoxin domain-containing protein [Candidatus Desulfobacillus sp.]|nr:redoxin domain-containing protein [Candidatus Desulfobacillus sp.]